MEEMCKKFCFIILIPLFQVPSAEDPSKIIAKKVYYLACSFCRWTTRDLGLPDQVISLEELISIDIKVFERFRSLTI